MPRKLVLLLWIGSLSATSASAQVSFKQLRPNKPTSPIQSKAMQMHVEPASILLVGDKMLAPTLEQMKPSLTHLLQQHALQTLADRDGEQGQLIGYDLPRTQFFEELEYESGSEDVLVVRLRTPTLLEVHKVKRDLMGKIERAQFIGYVESRPEQEPLTTSESNRSNQALIQQLTTLRQWPPPSFSLFRLKQAPTMDAASTTTASGMGRLGGVLNSVTLPEITEWDFKQDQVWREGKAIDKLVELRDPRSFVALLEVSHTPYHAASFGRGRNIVRAQFHPYEPRTEWHAKKALIDLRFYWNMQQLSQLRARFAREQIILQKVRRGDGQLEHQEWVDILATYLQLIQHEQSRRVDDHALIQTDRPDYQALHDKYFWHGATADFAQEYYRGFVRDVVAKDPFLAPLRFGRGLLDAVKHDVNSAGAVGVGMATDGAHGLYGSDAGMQATRSALWLIPAAKLLGFGLFRAKGVGHYSGPTKQAKGYGGSFSLPSTWPSRAQGVPSSGMPNLTWSKSSNRPTWPSPTTPSHSRPSNGGSTAVTAARPTLIRTPLRGATMQSKSSLPQQITIQPEAIAPATHHLGTVLVETALPILPISMTSMQTIPPVEVTITSASGEPTPEQESWNEERREQTAYQNFLFVNGLRSEDYPLSKWRARGMPLVSQAEVSKYFASRYPPAMEIIELFQKALRPFWEERIFLLKDFALELFRNYQQRSIDAMDDPRQRFAAVEDLCHALTEDTRRGYGKPRFQVQPIVIEDPRLEDAKIMSQLSTFRIRPEDLTRWQVGQDLKSIYPQIDLEELGTIEFHLRFENPMSQRQGVLDASFEPLSNILSEHQLPNSVDHEPGSLYVRDLTGTENAHTLNIPTTASFHEVDLAVARVVQAYVVEKERSYSLHDLNLSLNSVVPPQLQNLLSTLLDLEITLESLFPQVPTMESVTISVVIQKMEFLLNELLPDLNGFLREIDSHESYDAWVDSLNCLERTQHFLKQHINYDQLKRLVRSLNDINKAALQKIHQFVYGDKDLYKELLVISRHLTPLLELLQAEEDGAILRRQLTTPDRTTSLSDESESIQFSDASTMTVQLTNPQQPCPCGSGKSRQDCCGNNSAMLGNDEPVTNPFGPSRPMQSPDVDHEIPQPMRETSPYQFPMEPGFPVIEDDASGERYPTTFTPYISTLPHLLPTTPHESTFFPEPEETAPSPQIDDRDQSSPPEWIKRLAEQEEQPYEPNEESGPTIAPQSSIDPEWGDEDNSIEDPDREWMTDEENPTEAEIDFHDSKLKELIDSGRFESLQQKDYNPHKIFVELELIDKDEFHRIKQMSDEQYEAFADAAVSYVIWYKEWEYEDLLVDLEQEHAERTTQVSQHAIATIRSMLRRSLNQIFKSDTTSQSGRLRVRVDPGLEKGVYVKRQDIEIELFLEDELAAKASAQRWDDFLKLTDLEIETGFEGQGIERLVLASILNEWPNIKKIEHDLTGTNQDTFWKVLEESGSMIAAFRATDYYQSATELTFSRIHSHSTYKPDRSNAEPPHLVLEQQRPGPWRDPLTSSLVQQQSSEITPSTPALQPNAPQLEWDAKRMEESLYFNYLQSSGLTSSQLPIEKWRFLGKPLRKMTIDRALLERYPHFVDYVKRVRERLQSSWGKRLYLLKGDLLVLFRTYQLAQLTAQTKEEQLEAFDKVITAGVHHLSAGSFSVLQSVFPDVIAADVDVQARLAGAGLTIEPFQSIDDATLSQFYRKSGPGTALIMQVAQAQFLKELERTMDQSDRGLDGLTERLEELTGKPDLAGAMTMYPITADRYLREHEAGHGLQEFATFRELGPLENELLPEAGADSEETLPNLLAEIEMELEDLFVQTDTIDATALLTMLDSASALILEHGAILHEMVEDIKLYRSYAEWVESLPIADATKDFLRIHIDFPSIHKLDKKLQNLRSELHGNDAIPIQDQYLEDARELYREGGNLQQWISADDAIRAPIANISSNSAHQKQTPHMAQLGQSQPIIASGQQPSSVREVLKRLRQMREEEEQLEEEYRLRTLQIPNLSYSDFLLQLALPQNNRTAYEEYLETGERLSESELILWRLRQFSDIDLWQIYMELLTNEGFKVGNDRFLPFIERLQKYETSRHIRRVYFKLDPESPRPLRESEQPESSIRPFPNFLPALPGYMTVRTQRQDTQIHFLDGSALIPLDFDEHPALHKLFIKRLIVQPNPMDAFLPKYVDAYLGVNVTQPNRVRPVGAFYRIAFPFKEIAYWANDAEETSPGRFGYSRYLAKGPYAVFSKDDFRKFGHLDAYYWIYVEYGSANAIRLGVEMPGAEDISAGSADNFEVLLSRLNLFLMKALELNYFADETSQAHVSALNLMRQDLETNIGWLSGVDVDPAATINELAEMEAMVDEALSAKTSRLDIQALPRGQDITQQVLDEQLIPALLREFAHHINVRIRTSLSEISSSTFMKVRGLEGSVPTVDIDLISASRKEDILLTLTRALALLYVRPLYDRSPESVEAINRLFDEELLPNELMKFMRTIENDYAQAASVVIDQSNVKQKEVAAANGRLVSFDLIAHYFVALTVLELRDEYGLNFRHESREFPALETGEPVTALYVRTWAEARGDKFSYYTVHQENREKLAAFLRSIEDIEHVVDSILKHLR